MKEWRAEMKNGEKDRGMERKMAEWRAGKGNGEQDEGMESRKVR